MITPESTLINIGSGQRPFGPGWINVDKQERWKPDIVASGESLPMFENNEADLIVLHHVLEHFGCNESVGLLRECSRILNPRGSLLIFVPNMWELSAMWREGVISEQIYMTSVYGAYMGDEADRHKWGFTKRSLMGLVYSIGMRGKEFDWRPIPGADIARDRWIIGMEANKQ